MRTLDWIVLAAFVSFTVIYGILKGRGSKTTRSYILADKSMPWYAVALSIMATQASAITFVSTTGQAYADGMRWVQVYFGLPIAMVILSAVAVPIYHKLNVFTAYEYLEKRFDLKTRTLTSLIFLVQRGLADGLSLYASAIILSIIMGWNVVWTLRLIGLIVITYTVAGGVKGVNWNDFQQFLVIMGGMVVALIMTIHLLPNDVSFPDAVSIAGLMGRLNAVDFTFDMHNRYNFWSGLIGGLFIALSYFGTDQSQVQRYLTAKSIAQSRLGLLFNGIAKIPMQFFILFVGAMVFVFYQFVTPPLFFNPQEVAAVQSSKYSAEYNRLEKNYQDLAQSKQQQIRNWLSAKRSQNLQEQSVIKNELMTTTEQLNSVRKNAVDLMKANHPSADTNDTNYVFLTFVIHYLPAGVVGLIIVVIFAATMSSTSSELNSLGTTIVIDVYKRLIKKEAPDEHYLNATRIATAAWGIFSVSLAERVSRLGNLIEAVNILGSLFYGTVLGVFVLAFFVKRVQGTAVFIGALVGEVVVYYLFKFTTISFLWYNVFGCLTVILAAMILQSLAGWQRRVTQKP